MLWVALLLLTTDAVVSAFSCLPSSSRGHLASCRRYQQLWANRDQTSPGEHRDKHAIQGVHRKPNHKASRQKSQHHSKPPQKSSGAALELSRSLAQMEGKYDSGNGPRPELSHYVEVMKAWTESGFLDGPQRAARVFERIEKFGQTPGYQHIQLTMECYQIVIKAFAARHPGDAETWLKRLESRWRHQLDTDNPWSSTSLHKSYNICLDSWSRWSNLSTKGRGSPARAVALLQQLRQLSDIDPEVGPDNFSYSSVLRALARTGNAKEATKILSEMEQQYEEDPLTSNVQPDRMAFSSVVHALAVSNGGERAALEAEQLLTHMVELHSSGANRNAKPNAYTYEGVITAWAKSRTGTKGAKRAELIFEHMNKLYETGNQDVKPLTMNINAVVKAWSVCRGGVEAAEKCESILRRMDPDSLFCDQDRLQIWPNIETANAVISAWANAGTKNAPTQAESVLEYLDEWNQNVPENRWIQPTVDSYNMIIASYAKSIGKDSARKAEALLYRLMNLGAPDDSRGEAVEKAFGMVISCWSKSSDPNAPERAEQLLRVLEKNHREGLSEAKPNVIIFSQVIDAWSKSRKADAARKAKAIFDQFLDNKDIDSRPNTITFNSMLNALANSNDPEAATDAEEILDKMYKLRKEPGWDVEPNSRSVVSYMTCLAKRSKDNSSYAQKAEDLIDSMLVEVKSGNTKMMPDSFAFTTAVNAWVWSGSGSTSDGVLRVVDRMETLYYQGVISSRPHAICYNTAVRFFIDVGDLKKADALVGRMEAAFLRGMKEAAADRLTYAALLNAYAQSGDSSSHDLALELFRRQRYQATAGNRAARPHSVCYNMVMASLAKNENSKVRSQALSVLEEMKRLSREGNDEVRPDTVSYSTAINVLSKSPEKDSAAMAIMLLTEMESRYNAGDPKSKPNLFSFNSVLNALSKSRTNTAAMKAEELLAKMKQLSESDTSYSDVSPDLLSFTSVIEAWAGVKADGAPERAEAILRQMIRRGDDSCLHPDVVTYNKVLLSWARNSNPAKAEALLREMEASDKVDPDRFSYKTVLLAWSQQEGGAANAETLLGFMEKNMLQGNANLKPDILCYKAVAAAWEDEGDSVSKQADISRRLASFQKAQF
jgi:pentatricopeptide repeat protein